MIKRKKQYNLIRHGLFIENGSLEGSGKFGTKRMTSLEISERFGDLFKELEVDGLSPNNYITIVLLLVLNTMCCLPVHAYNPYLRLCISKRDAEKLREQWINVGEDTAFIRSPLGKEMIEKSVASVNWPQGHCGKSC